MALFVPTWHAENIYKIDVNFYKENNIKITGEHFEEE